MDCLLVALLAFNHCPEDDDRLFRNDGGVAISADGNLIVYGRDRNAFVWDRQKNKVRRLVVDVEGGVAACRINGSSNRIVVSVSKYSIGSGSLLLFDRNAKRLRKHVAQIAHDPKPIGFLSTPERVYRGVEAWNLATGERTNLLSEPRRPRGGLGASVYPLPNGYLVTGQRIPGEGPLEPAPGMFVSYIFEGYATDYSLAGTERRKWLCEALESADFVSPVGKSDLLAIGHSSACVISAEGKEEKCFEIENGERMRPTRYRGWVLVTNGERACLKDAATGNLIAELASTRADKIVDVAVSPKSETLVTLRGNGFVQLWNTKSGQEIDHRWIRAGTKVRN